MSITEPANLGSMPTPTPGFGANLKRLREARGLTQPELARLLGVHAITIAKWEGQQNEPGGRNLLNLSKVLRVSISSLLGERRPATEQAIDGYMGSPYAQLRAPVTDVELDFLRYAIESLWVEGRPTPKVLDSILEAARLDPDLLPKSSK